MNEHIDELMADVIREYVRVARNSFDERMDAWQIEIYEKETNEVIGGLLARQLTVARNIAEAPQIWNCHVLPILLRTMADVYITFSWIARDPKSRSRQFVEYGLGQEKLAIEKYSEVVAEADEPDPDAMEFVRIRKQMLDAERASFLVPVNVGSWSQMSTRSMAKEVGETQFYDLVFAQFSSAVHSTWQHIWRLNMCPCTNPLHMGHRVPFDPELPSDALMFTHSAKYLCKTFARFDAIFLDDADYEPYKCYDLVWNRFAACFDSEENEKV